jgi:predicted transcriptional regulator
MERRSFDFIIGDILEKAQNGDLQTHIMVRANLSHKPLTRIYLPFLKEKGFLEKKENFYITTEKGIKYLKAYKKLKELLEPQND